MPLKKKQLKCPACGSQNPSDSERCDICGTLLDLTEEEKHIFDYLSNISKVGRSRAEKIIKSGFSRIEDLEEANMDDLTSIKGIGSNIAKNIVDFLEDKKNEEGLLKTCDKCGSLMEPGRDICQKCNSDMIEEQAKEKEERCSLCGSTLTGNGDSCPVCSTPIRRSDDASLAQKGDEIDDDMGEDIDEKIEELDEKETEEIVEEIKELEENIIDSEDEKDGENIVDEDTYLQHVPPSSDGQRRTIKKENSDDEVRDKKKKRYEAYPGELEEDKARIKDFLEGLDDEWIYTDKVEEYFNELLSYENMGRYEKALDQAIDLLFDVEYLEMLKEELDELKDMKKDLSNEESKKELDEGIEKIKGLCEKGKYEGALDLADSLTELYLKDQKRESERRFEVKLKRVRKNLKVARETQIDLKNIKTSVKRGIESKRSGDLKKGISYLEKTLGRFELLFVFSSKLEEAKGKLNEIRKMGGDTADLSQRLKELKDLAGKGKLEKANDKIKELITKIDKRKEECQAELDPGVDDTNEEKKSSDKRARLNNMNERVKKANEKPLLRDEEV